MGKLKIAVQKSGRLSKDSLQLFKECGLRLSNSARRLKADASNFPAEFLFLRDDDIPQYVEQGVADIGIIGENEVWEQQKTVDEIRKLGFAKCRMALAVSKNEDYTGIHYFNNKKIATTYPRVIQDFFEKKDIAVTIEKLSGSVEIATGIGLADGIFDIVETGSTLLMNGLKEVEAVAESQAVLIASPDLSGEKQTLVDRILFRIDAVKKGEDNKYILLNAPDDAIEDISNLIPGMKSPTILPLKEEGWSSLHSVVQEDDFWNVIDQLKKLGAQGILVSPIEKMVL